MAGGSLRTAAMATALRVPLGAMLLVAYDQVLTVQLRREAAKLYGSATS
jgi:hypothetical protein